MRISASKVASFQYAKENDCFDSFIADFSGRRTFKMSLGVAVHEVLEKPNACFVEGGYRSGDFVFDGIEFEKFNKMFSTYTKEVKTETHIMGHTVVCKCDGILGKNIIDIKTSVNPADYRKIERQAASVQWMLYLKAFQASRFDFFHLRAMESKGIYFVVLDCQHCQYAFPGMDEYLKGWIGEYVEFCRENDLVKFHEVKT